MVRSFGAAFTAQLSAVNSRPYLVLAVTWTTGIRYYTDRPVTDFVADGIRSGSPNENRVLEWGELSLELNEGGIGGADEIQITLSDTDKAIKALLEVAPQQRQAVDLYRMFDDDTVDWTTGKELIFAGTLMPYQWDEGEQSVTLTISEFAKKNTTSVGKVADRSVFTQVPIEYEDAPLPIAWGSPRRIPAVPVQFPWKTSTIEDAPGELLPVTAGSLTIDVLDHPDDMGITVGSGNSKLAWLGTDQVTGYFTQSTDKLNTPSTFTITGQADQTVASAPFQYHALPSKWTTRDILVQRAQFNPQFFNVTSWFANDPDKKARIYNAATGAEITPPVTVIEIEEPGGYSDAWVRIAINQDIDGVSGILSLLDVSNARRNWPAGTALQARGSDAVVKYIYSSHVFGSTIVDRVEGFGTYTDEAGENVEGFVTINPEFYTVNDSDSTWSAGLGHSVQTITFQAPPRLLVQELSGSQLYVTCNTRLNFVETVTLYFVVSSLFGTGNVDIINLGAFNFAHQAELSAAGLEEEDWAYVQLESRTGLDLMHEICLLAHAVLVSDQGGIRLVNLLNDAPDTTVATFDEHTIVAETLEIEESSIDDLTSHLIGEWRRDWDGVVEPLALVRYNATVRDTFGENHRDFAMNAWSQKDAAEHYLDFWLTRWTKIYRTVRFGAFPEALVLQPGDWITVSFTDGEGNVLFANQDMEVRRVTDSPGGLGTPPTLTIEARFALFSY